MKYVITARPQRLNVFTSNFCHFWANNKGCRFCDIVTHLKEQKKEWKIPIRLDAADVEETLREALREPGRFTSICLTSGSDTRGPELFDREVDYYVETLQAVGRVFKTKRFPASSSHRRSTKSSWLACMRKPACPVTPPTLRC